MWMLALGPAPGAVRRRRSASRDPTRCSMELPGFDGMRVPARLWMVSVLCLAVLAALVDRADRVAPRATAGRGLRHVAACCSTAWPRAFPVVAAPGMRVTTDDGARAPRASAARERDGDDVRRHRAGAARLQRLQRIRSAAALRRCAICSSSTIRGSSSGWPRPSRSRSSSNAPRDADGAWTAYVEQHPAPDALTSRPSGPATRSRRPAPSRRRRSRRAATRRLGHHDDATRRDINADPRRRSRHPLAHAAAGRTANRSWPTSDANSASSAVVLCLGAYPGQYPRGARGRGVAGRRRVVPGLRRRHRARNLRRGAAIAARGAGHAAGPARRRPLHPPAPDGKRAALRLDDRRAARSSGDSWSAVTCDTDARRPSCLLGPNHVTPSATRSNFSP